MSADSSRDQRENRPFISGLLRLPHNNGTYTNRSPPGWLDAVPSAAKVTNHPLKQL
jgi:hypothetical protein